MAGRPLSDSEIRAALPGVRVLTYNNLNRFRSIDELLAPAGACVFLVINDVSPQSLEGHWMCCFDAGDHIQVFDSLGEYPDDELGYLPMKFREATNQAKAMLSHLLYDDGRPVRYNDHKLQSSDRHVATCGRHCIVRLLNRGLGEDEYARRLRSQAKRRGVTPDDVVVELTKILDI